MSMKEAVKLESGIEIVMEESPGYDSQGNGEVERAVQMVPGQFRTMKDALESRYGVRFDGTHSCIPWLMAHASDIITRFHVYEDGRTGYHNWRGKPFNKDLVEFGECVFYLRPGSRGKGKFMPRWEEGIRLGLTDKSFEVIIGTNEGVIKVRDIRRKGKEAERWSLDKFNAFQGTPWEPIPGREGIELQTRVHVPKDTDPVNPVTTGEDEEVIPRRVRISSCQGGKKGYGWG